MGGLMFILGIFVSILICGWKGMMAGDFEHLYIFFFALIFGGIGFLDDFEKVKHKQNLGLTAIQKFLLQLAAAVAFLCLMRFEGMLTPNLYVPFFNTQIVMSWWVYMVFAAFVIVGTVNAVNITDGIDGLAGSVTVPVGLFFTVLAIWWQGYEQLGIYAAALVGGILGFLIYNFHPAKVFMGDTGSLFLGGTVAALAFAYDMPLVLIPVGFVYICETLSDILQVIYFKATHGKRLFKMAPLHHHFELCGWSEVKLVARVHQRECAVLPGGAVRSTQQISFFGETASRFSKMRGDARRSVPRPPLRLDTHSARKYFFATHRSRQKKD